jgi:hypothetical protein
MKVTMWGFYSGGNGNSIHWINPGSKITRRKNNNRRSRKINS